MATNTPTLTKTKPAGVTVTLKYVRHSAKKLRPFTRVVVGKNVQDALRTTEVMTQDSAHFLNKLLKMAVSAAVEKEFDPETIVITAAMATEGPKIKRMRPNARGRSNAYQKHLAHLSLTVGPALPKPVKAKRVVKKGKEI